MKKIIFALITVISLLLTVPCGAEKMEGTFGCVQIRLATIIQKTAGGIYLSSCFLLFSCPICKLLFTIFKSIDLSFVQSFVPFLLHRFQVILAHISH